MKDFVQNTMAYLEQYHKRSYSESGFLADKRMFGWGIAKRREDRVDYEQFTIWLWHNLFTLMHKTILSHSPLMVKTFQLLLEVF